MTTEAEALQTAVEMHQLGQLAEAEKAYHRILRANPNQPDALHLLGLVALQSERPDEAIDCITRAIAVSPTHPMYHNNLGKAYQTRGNVSQAETCYERALALDPSFVLAHYNLGTLHERVQPSEAQRHYERAIALAPHHVLAHNNLGQALRAQGKLAEAVAEFRKALASQPDFAAALSNLREATSALEETAGLAGQSAEAHLNLGSAHAAAKDWDRALASFDEALRLAPDSAEARCQLASALKTKGESSAAAAQYEETLRRHSEHFEALLGYASLLESQGRAAESLPFCERALAVVPDSAAAHFQRALALQAARRFRETEQELREAIRRRPDYPEAHVALGLLTVKNVSHEHRCIFIHIPKNGGTSVKQALDMPGGGHFAWQNYAQHYKRYWESYTSFAVIRNPWDRAVSAFQHARMKHSYWHDDLSGLHPDYRVLQDKSFAQCVAILDQDRAQLQHESWDTQSRFVVDFDSPDKRIVVGHLLRFESLGEDFAEFCLKLGIDAHSLPTVNTSQRSRDYREYYNDQTRQMVAHVYREDIERFGYAF